MGVNPASDTKNAESVEYWKSRYERQKFLISSMASLLNRYGSLSVRWIPLLQKFRAVRRHVYGFSSRRDGVWPLTSIFRFTIEAFLRMPSDLHRFIALYVVNSRNSSSPICSSCSNDITTIGLRSPLWKTSDCVATSLKGQTLWQMSQP